MQALTYFHRHVKIKIYKINLKNIYTGEKMFTPKLIVTDLDGTALKTTKI